MKNEKAKIWKKKIISQLLESNVCLTSIISKYRSKEIFCQLIEIMFSKRRSIRSIHSFQNAFKKTKNTLRDDFKIKLQLSTCKIFRVKTK